jgi:beta-glucosidase
MDKKKGNNNSDLFRNAELPLNVRVDDLVSRLTLKEKAGLVSSKQKGIERLGISEWYVGWEIARGYVGRTEEEPSTVLPQPIGMAAMFDPDLMYKLGELAGNETRIYYQKNKKGKLMIWGPTVDMERDPRWGRTEEAYGEDPYLTGQMTIAYTKGLKGEDPYYLRTVPTLKHFCANNNEIDRGSSSSNLEPRTKHEYYYNAFKPSIVEGGAVSIMAAYNEISGVPAVLNPDLKTIVKDQWGLDFIVSDGADFSQTVTDHHYVDTHAESVALSIRAGSDIMTDDADLVQESVLEALEKGMLTEEELDESIKRVLKVRFRLGEFDPDEKNPYANIPESLLNCDEYKKLNNLAAKEQVILLKNTGLLPLYEDTSKKVAVIGPIGDKNYMDWYTGYSDYNISVVDGLKELLGDKNIIYDNSYDHVALKSKSTGKYLRVNDDESVDATSEHISMNETFEFHDWDFGSQNLFSIKNQKFLRDEKDIKASGLNTYGWFVKEWLKCKEYQEKDDSYITMDTWNDHEVIVNQEGKLTTCQKSRLTNNKQFIKETISDGIERAVKLAKESDIAVVCVGNDPLQVAKECYDRPDITLPRHQSELIKAVYSANPNTIVVVISSYPYALNWENDNIPAILYTSHAGPELGHAIADVLYGRFNPAGRTPMTWYKSIRELPDIMDYDIIKNNVTYLYYDGEPLYPFGYGLSYSEFLYSNLSVEKLCAFEQDNEEQLKLRITLEVENISNTDGDEIVQIYYKANSPRVKRPLRQLCAFKRVHIKALEKIKVEFIVKENALEFYDVTREKFCVESGEYTFMAGASSKDTRLEKTIYIDSEIIPAQTLRNTTPIINYDDKSGVIMNFSKEKNKHYLSTFGMEEKYIKFGDVDLTRTKHIELVAATPVGKATIKVFVDTLDGEPIGEVLIPITGGGDQFEVCFGDISESNGVHDLYLVPTNGVSLLSIKLI